MGKERKGKGQFDLVQLVESGATAKRLRRPAPNPQPYLAARLSAGRQISWSSPTLIRNKHDLMTASLSVLTLWRL